jgi:hypothetical protein
LRIAQVALPGLTNGCGMRLLQTGCSSGVNLPFYVVERLCSAP